MIEIISNPIIAKNANSWYFRIKYRVGEKIIDKRKQGFSTKKEARIAEMEFEAQLLQEKIPNKEVNICLKEYKLPTIIGATLDPVEADVKKKSSILIKDLFDEYVKYVSTRLKAGSVRSASDVLRLFVLPWFGEREADSLSTSDICAWQISIVEKGFSYKYKSKIYCGFTALLNFGIKFYDLKENVVCRVGNFKNTERKKEMMFWTEEEFKQFISVVDNDLYRIYFSFLYLTGCRKGESLALTWNDIDFKNEEVKISKSLNRKQKLKGIKEIDNVPEITSDMGWHISNSRSYEITTPKNKSSYRNILLPKNLVQMLLNYKQQCEKEYGFNDNWFIFGGAEPLSDQTIRRRLNNYADRAGVKKIRVHDLRHSHASLLINKGQNILIVSQRLGHSDITQTLNTYSHLMPNVQKQIIGALNFDF